MVTTNWRLVVVLADSLLFIFISFSFFIFIFFIFLFLFLFDLFIDSFIH